MSNNTARACCLPKFGSTESAMRDKMAQAPKSEQTRHSRPYHIFVDRKHPDHYRQTEIQALKRAIRAKENRLVFGMPDTGISNLLRFLVTRTDWGERNVTFAYVDCDALDDCLNSEMFFEEIAFQFYEQGLGGKPEKEAQGYEHLKRLVLGAEGDPLDRLVVVANKTDRMLEIVDRTFYRKLKALTDLNKRVCHLFAVGIRVADKVDPEGLLFAGRRLIVGRFNERDFGEAVAEEAQRLEVKFDSAAQEQLLYLTGGHPGLLRAVSSAVVDEKLDLSDLEARLPERSLVRDDVRSRCQRIWQALDAAQQTALHAIANGQPSSVTETALDWFQNFGLVDEYEGEYRLFSPIFERFVVAQEGFSSSEAVTISAGKVFRGDEEVDLRPLEQKLLACLMAEPGRVYTHDEIAWYVWETDEVTPDMITGVVSQLRSRLGKSYIRTHWGRGYEFVDENRADDED